MPAGIHVGTHGGDRAFHCHSLPIFVHLPRDRGHGPLETAIDLENFQRPGGLCVGAVAIHVHQQHEVVLPLPDKLTAHMIRRKHVHSGLHDGLPTAQGETVVLLLQEVLMADKVCPEGMKPHRLKLHCSPQFVMCVRELCKMGRANKERTANGQKLTTGLGNVAGRKRGAGGQEEDWTQIRDSMSGEKKKNRNKPSHADLAVERLKGTSPKWIAAT